MSYLQREEALPTIRGRVRFAEQARRRYDLPLPIEVRYDDYTVDVEANRLVKAALRRIERLRLRDPRLRRRTAEALASFDGVSDVIFDARHLPTFSYTRLDERYRPVLELAALLVRNTSVDLHPGAATTSSILFDMNDVFEDFVFAAIGDELRSILPTRYRWRQGKSIALDEDRSVRAEVSPPSVHQIVRAAPACAWRPSTSQRPSTTSRQGAASSRRTSRRLPSPRRRRRGRYA
jgi:5-methylcytosine-specific restriction enzyme subunit McrC